MRRIIRYLTAYRKQIILILTVSIVFSIFNLMNAWLMGRLTDAIFYRTKGVPLSIAWEKKDKVKEVIINFTRNTPWTTAAAADLKKALEQVGGTVLSDQITGEALVVKFKASTELSQDPLKLTNDLQQRFSPKFGPLSVYITAAPTKTPKQLLLFPQFYTVFIIPIILVGVYLVMGLLRYAQNFMIGAMGLKIVMRMRNEIYENLHNLSLSYFEKNQTGQSGQLISRILNDIQSINFLFTTGIFEMLLEPLVVMIGLVWGFILNWKLTLLFFIVFPLLALPINYLSKKLRQVTKLVMNQVAEVTGVLEETLAAIKVVKAFGMEEYEVNRFRRETKHSYDAAMKGLRISRIFLPVIEFMVAIALAIFLIYGGSLVIGEKLSPGEFFTFIFLMSYMANPIRKLSGVFGQIPSALAGADRVFELIDQRSEVVEATNPIELPQIQGKVEFDRVSFGYDPDQVVLHEIDLTVNPGEVIALVGPSGAGKTTMVNLVARFYDPLAGQIKIDGQNLTQLKMTTFRRQMGIVPQETVLFRGSIADNIAYGKIGASMDEIVAAAQAANVAEFVDSLPEGYQTKVGSRGATLSGGQRQRVAIARALLRDPRILILDEATSSLDTQSELLVQEALQRLMKDRTCFVIAHRLSTIQNADRIVVLEQGRIIEVGTHRELLTKKGCYARLYQTQFRTQE